MGRINAQISTLWIGVHRTGNFELDKRASIAHEEERVATADEFPQMIFDRKDRPPFRSSQVTGGWKSR